MTFGPSLLMCLRCQRLRSKDHPRGTARSEGQESLRFNFQTPNNQAKYEALIVGLTLANNLGVTRLRCLSDSQLTVEQVNGQFQVKDPLLLKYYHKVTDMQSTFKEVKLEHIPRENKLRVDKLSKLATGKTKGRNDMVI